MSKSTALLANLQNVVLSKHPSVKNILQTHGPQTLSEYAGHCYRPGAAVSQLLSQTIASVVRETLGDLIATEVVSQLERFPVASTADHHGPLFSALFVNSNLLAQIGAREQNLKVQLVLACSIVPLKNETFPRGIIWKNCKLPFFPSGKKEKQLVYGCNAAPKEKFNSLPQAYLERFVRVFLEKNIPEISLIEKGIRDSLWGTVHDAVKSPEGIEFLKRNCKKKGFDSSLVDKVTYQFTLALHQGQLEQHKLKEHFLADLPENLFASNAYETQCTLLNEHLWKQLFPDAPRLVYLSAETVSSQMLIHLLEEEDAMIAKLLLDRKGREAAIRIFKGIYGAWDYKGDGSGTHFFWQKDRHAHMQPLRITDNVLSGKDFTLPLEPDSLIHALKAKDIVPSLVLTFILFIQNGLRCLGGFSQVNYLPKIQHALISWLKEQEFHYMIESVESVGTADLIAGPILLVDSNTAPAHFAGMDYLLSNKHLVKEQIHQIRDSRTLEETIQIGLPQQYRMALSFNEQDPNLRDLTIEEIIAAQRLA